MKRLFATVLAGQFAFIVMLASVRFAGASTLTIVCSFTTQITHDSRRTYGGWCWREVCPGVTIDSMLAPKIANWIDLKLTRDSKPGMTITTVHLESITDPRWTIIMLIRQPNHYVQRIQIQPEMNAISIGDLMLSVGTPATRRVEYAYGLWTTVFCFEERLCAGMIDNQPHITYWSKVDFLEYAARETQIDDRTLQITHPWRGFTAAPRPTLR